MAKRRLDLLGETAQSWRWRRRPPNRRSGSPAPRSARRDRPARPGPARAAERSDRDGGCHCGWSRSGGPPRGGRRGCGRRPHSRRSGRRSGDGAPASTSRSRAVSIRSSWSSRVEAGQLEAGAFGDAFGDALPDRVEVELNLLAGGEDRLDHAADRLDAVDQGGHRIDEEAGLEAVAAEDLELPGHADRRDRRRRRDSAARRRRGRGRPS